MIQHLEQMIRPAVILILTAFIASCEEDYDFRFKNVNEAFNACRKELSFLSGKEKMGYKNLTGTMNRFIALQDSTIKTIARSDSMLTDDNTVKTFFSLTDSIRDQIARLALSEERKLQDVVYMKMNTTYDKRNVEKNKYYKLITDFYENLDGKPLFDNEKITLDEYRKLLSKTSEVKREKDLMTFMEKEDICYRSYLRFIDKISMEESEKIVAATEIFYGNLENAASKDTTQLNDRLLTYLYVRMNRRIILAANRTVEMLSSGKAIKEEIRETMRWNILQPYLTIDKNSAAYLTDSQRESAIKIGRKLPDYLAQIDGILIEGKQKEKTVKTLAKAMLNMYLKQNL